MDDAPGTKKMETKIGKAETSRIFKTKTSEKRQKPSVLETVAKGQGQFDPTNKRIVEDNRINGLIKDLMAKSKAIAAARMINSGSPSRPSPRAWSIDAQGSKYLPGSTKGGTTEFLKPAISESYSTYLQRNPKV